MPTEKCHDLTVHHTLKVEGHLNFGRSTFPALAQVGSSTAQTVAVNKSAGVITGIGATGANGHTQTVVITSDAIKDESTLLLTVSTAGVSGSALTTAPVLAVQSVVDGTAVVKVVGQPSPSTSAGNYNVNYLIC